MQNKVYSPQNVMKSGKYNSFSKSTNESSLEVCRKDLQDGLESLERLLYISNNTHDLPVAFASDAIYVLERNGHGDRSFYEDILIPILKKKIEYLHAEGIAHAVWGLANAEIYDKELWGQLASLI